MRYKILFVEDDPGIKLLYSAVFDKQKFELTLLEDIRETFKFIKTNRPDLILLDLILPKRAGETPIYEKYLGMELLKKIHADSSLSTIPVIVFSNLNDKKVKAEAQKLGAIDYIIKSTIKPKEMVKIIEDRLTSKIPISKPQ